MSDIEPSAAPLRPRPRPEDLGGDAAAPQARPERMSVEETLASLEEAEDGRVTRPLPRPDGLGATVPEETLATATEEGVLHEGETTLIGLFGGPDGSTALVRLPSGAIVRVAAGEQVAGGRVTAIDEEAVHLRRGGETIRLTMPG